MRLIGFDLETAGRDPFVHPPISFGAVVVNEAWQELDTLELKIQLPKDAPFEPEALVVNRYTPEAWANALPPSEAALVIGRFLDTHAGYVGFSKSRGRELRLSRLLGFNVLTFDLPFLTVLFKQHGIEPMWHHHVLDVFNLAAWRYVGNTSRPLSLSLTSLLFFTEYKRDPLPGELEQVYPEAHSPVTDTRLALKLARLLTEELRLNIFAAPPDAKEVL